MVDALRDLGFKNVRSVENCAEAWSVIESEGNAPSWIISDLSKNSRISAQHILLSALLYEDLNNCMVSLVLPPEDQVILPDAFALGLLSYHAVPTSKGDFVAELEALMARLKEYDNSATLVAAHYLRDYLAKAKLFDDLLALEENLIRAFPEEKGLLVCKAEALLLVGRAEEAGKFVAQAKLLGINATKSGEQLDELLKLTGVDVPVSSFAEAYGFKKALVVDPDEIVRSSTEQTLKDIGVTEIACYTNGEEAWQWLDAQQEQPRLMIIEWRIPGLSGPALLQRIKVKYGCCPPVLVYSSLVKKTDRELLREIGVNNIIEKPAEKTVLTSMIMNCISATEHGVAAEQVAHEIRHLAIAGQIDKARALRDQFVSRKDITSAQRLSVDCFLAFKQGEYSLAHDFAIEALKAGGDNLFLTNLLGKIFLQMNQHEQAIRCFKKAHAFSPKNIERLLDLAEAQAGIGAEEAAVEALEKAKNVDTEHPAVAQTEAVVMVNLGKTDFAQKLLETMGDPSEVVATLNNTAVARAKAGDIEGSLKLYEQTYASLPVTKSELRALVLYNQSLAFVRYGKMTEALAKATDASSQGGKSALTNKLATLKRQISAAIAKGRVVAIRSMRKPIEKKQDATRLPIATFRRIGDYGCHIVFQPKAVAQALTKSALSDVPRLKVDDTATKKVS